MASAWATMDVEIASARSPSRPLPGIRRAVTATIQRRLAGRLHRLPFECVARKAILWEGNAGRTRIPHAPNWSGHLAAEHDWHCSTNYEVLSRESLWGPMMRLVKPWQTSECAPRIVTNPGICPVCVTFRCFVPSRPVRAFCPNNAVLWEAKNGPTPFAPPLLPSPLRNVARSPRRSPSLAIRGHLRQP